jgi:hypothetical protein
MVGQTPIQPSGVGGKTPTHVEKEIDRVISAVIKALSEKRIVKVVIDQADAFWGYYVRGFDASGEEIFTEACVLDKAYALDYADMSGDSKIMFAIETLFISLVERVLRDHGFSESEAGTYIKRVVEE